MSLQTTLDARGQFPDIVLQITSLETGKTLGLSNFLDYSFDSSLLVPVDTFNFTFVAPDDPLPFTNYFNEGDICQLYANGDIIATGLIDMIDIETDAEFGEKVQISGRDLMGQLEDHDAISLDSKPIYANNYTVSQVYKALSKDTRMRGLRVQNAPAKAYIFATEPGESKLSALQRYMEPLNVVSWMDPDGTVVIGRPNMAQPPLQQWILNKEKRISNCLQMKVSRAAAQIPNIMVPIWSAQVTDPPAPILPEKAIQNASAGPARLLGLNHRLPKSVIVSNPQGTSAQELSSVNALTVAGSNILQAYAKRELARQNVKEMLVQITIPGHYNDDGSPVRMDTVYNINYDRGVVSENMYCYQVQYRLTLDGGQRTNLFFCKLGRIVSDVTAP